MGGVLRRCVLAASLVLTTVVCLPPQADAAARVVRDDPGDDTIYQQGGGDSRFAQQLTRGARAALPFDRRFAIDQRGALTRAGNAVVTCYPPQVISCPDRRYGDGNNNVYATFIDVDGDAQTFDSSTARLTVPSGAQVSYARLYWGANLETQEDTPGLGLGNRRALDPTKMGEVKLKVPGGRYARVTAASGDIGFTTATTGGRVYGASADVTSTVQNAGPGVYTVADLQAARGYDSLGAFGGWSLVVAYADVTQPLRNLTVYDGFLDQTAGAVATNVDISGFKAPTRGPVTAQLGAITYDGDQGITGDSLRMKTATGPQTTLSDALNPAQNFFNSTVATLGKQQSDRDPTYTNTLGYDTDVVDASAAFRNSDTSARFSFSTTGDSYWPHALFAQIDLNQPKLEVTKTHQVVGGGPAQPGAEVDYKVTVKSAGPDDADKVVLTDPIPAGTTYVPGSLEITVGPSTSAKTDAAGDDEADCDGSTAIFRLGIRAGPTTGGRMVVGATTTIGFRVKLAATSAGKTIDNTATADYTGLDNPDVPGKATGDDSYPVSTIRFEKSATPVNPVEGDTVTYTVKASNPTTVDYDGATFTDDLTEVLDDATYNGDATADAGVAGYTEPNLTWTGDVPAGGTVTVTYSVTLKSPPTGDSQLVNVVTSTSPGNNCPPGSSDPVCSVTLPQAAIKIVKKAGPVDPKPGDKVTYTVTVTNIGRADYPNAQLTDDLTRVLDDATYNNDAVADSGLVGYREPELTWTGTVPKDGSVTITYSVTVNIPPGGDQELRNGVTAPGTNCADPTRPDCHTVIPLPALTVRKTAAPKDVKPGDIVRYTITVSNTGKAAFPGAEVTDDLTGVLDDARYDDDATATSGSVSYAEPKLKWTGDVPAGGTVTIRYTVTVNSPPTGDYSLRNAVTAPGTPCVTGKEPDCGTVTPLPALRFSKSNDKTEAKPGEKVTYTIVASNPGKGDYLAATFTDDLTGVLDDAAYNNDETAESGTPSYTEPRLTWVGDIPAGGSVKVTYSVTVNDPDLGDHLLRNVIGSASPGSNCIMRSKSGDCSTSTPVPGVRVSKKAAPASPGPGDKVTYTITVSNTGKTTLTGLSVVDDLTGVLDDATYNDDAAATTGTTRYARPKLTWTGGLAIGGTATITYSVTVNRPPGGDKVLTNAVVSDDPGSNCPPGSTDPDCSTTRPVGLLEIEKSASPTSAGAGDVVTYTVTARNTGAGVLPNATFTDDLTQVLRATTYRGDAKATAGTVRYQAPKLTWQGALRPGEAARVTYSVRVKNPVPAGATLVNVVVAPGSNCPPGATDPRCTERVPIKSLTVAKSADRKVAKPGQRVRYTITITNSGTAAYPQARFTDDLSKVLRAARYMNDAAATSGRVTYRQPRLYWQGDLAVGAKAVVTYSVKLRRGKLGTKPLPNVVTAPDSNCATPGRDKRCRATIKPARVPKFTG